MTNDSLQGTGEELGRIEIPDVGTVIFEDDGCGDSDTRIKFEDVDGRGYSSLIATVPTRNSEGDEHVVDRLASVGGGTVATDSGSGFERPGSFQCDDCGRTWPGKDNQTPDGDEDTCPECA